MASDTSFTSSGDQVQGPERCLRQRSRWPDHRDQLPLSGLQHPLVPSSLQGSVFRSHSPNNQRCSSPEHLRKLHEGAGDGSRTRRRSKRPVHGHGGGWEQQRVSRRLPGAAGNFVREGAGGGQTSWVALLQTSRHPAQGQEAGTGDPSQVEALLGDSKR